jgi:photosystem II stability/assembly factor-like uncharacterized protein
MTLKKSFLLVVVMMLTHVWAGEWTRSIGLGNTIWNLQACEDRVYAAKNNEIYYSDNQGKTWSAFNYKKYISNFFLASGHKKYMLKGDSVFCSACKDTIWNSILKVSSLQGFSIKGERIYFQKNDTFFVANLDGSDFRPISPKLTFPIKKFDVVGQTLFAVNKSWNDSSGKKHEENLYRYGPGDQAWVQLTDRSFPDDITSIAAAGDRIFIGSYNGLSVWSEKVGALVSLTSSLMGANKWVHNLFSGFGKLFIVSSNPITLNDDAIVSMGIPLNLIVIYMLDYHTFLTAAGDSTLYILNSVANSTINEAYYFQYDGTSFESKKLMFNNAIMGDYTTVDELFFDGSVLWAYSSKAGIFRSDDIGKSWGFVGNPDLNDLQIFTKLGDKLCAVAATKGVYLSSDAGVTWTPVNLGNDPNRRFLDAVISGSDAFITSTNGFFRTTDAGKTWTEINQKADRIGALAVHGRNIMLFTMDSIRQIIHSADGGTTWKTSYQVDSMAELFHSISASDAGALVHSSTRGILYSSDGGATWKPRNKGIADSLRINVLLCHQNTLLASTRVDSSWGGGWSAVHGDLFAWSDSLNSWVKQSIKKEPMSAIYLCSMGPYIYAYAWASGQYNEMFLSADNGKTWESLGAISYTDDHQQLSYAFSNKDFFVGSNNGLWRHSITNPVSYYSASLRPQRVDHARSGPTISYTRSGCTLHFKILSGFVAIPRLSLISVTGRKIADLQPTFCDGVAGTAMFRLPKLASGAFLYRLVLEGKVNTGKLFVPSKFAH